MAFAYGADENRVLQVESAAGVVTRTVYVGLGGTGKSLYERRTIGATGEHTFFIYAGSVHAGNAFALRVLDDNGNVTANQYLSFDELGSTTAVSDEKGHVASVAAAGSKAGVLGYDPWGARRNPDGQAADPSTFSPAPGRREFTGHETMAAVGLINMNGRIYDPIVGRFLSPDPNIQAATDLQSCGDQPSRQAKENAARVKERAADRGQVTKGKVGNLPVEVYGRDEEFRSAALAAAERDLKDGGDVATSMRKALGARLDPGGSGPKPLEIILTGNYGSFAVPGSNTVIVDVVDDVGSLYDSLRPGGHFTYERIIAHELGHAALGLHDLTIDPMQTIRGAENPIMRALGDTNDRQSYDWEH